MPLYDYFRAAGHDEARTTALRPGGPLGRNDLADGVDGLAVKNLDPVAAMGRLLALVLDVDWSTGLHDSATIWPTDPQPRDWGDVSEESPWVTGPWVVGLGRKFRDSLASVDDRRLPEISHQWQSVAELRGMNASTWALETVESFVGLSRRARDAEHSLFCWCCL